MKMIYFLTLFVMALSIHVKAQPTSKKAAPAKSKTPPAKTPASSQKNAAKFDPYDDPGWTLTWSLTIKGEGIKKNYPAQGEELKWKISRIYNGATILNFRAPMPARAIKFTPGDPKYTPASFAEALKTESFVKWMHVQQADSSGSPIGVPIHVLINDMLQTTLVVHEEGDVWEHTVDTKEWKADVFASSYDLTSLFIDKANNSYNVEITCFPKENFKKPEKQLRFLHTEQISKSENGHKGEPLHEFNQDSLRMSLTELKVPEVENLIKHAYITLPVDEPLHAQDGVYSFDSGEFVPTKPLISNIPETKTDVKVSVSIRFTKNR